MIWLLWNVDRNPLKTDFGHILFGSMPIFNPSELELLFIFNSLQCLFIRSCHENTWYSNIIVFLVLGVAGKLFSIICICNACIYFPSDYTNLEIIYKWYRQAAVPPVAIWAHLQLHWSLSWSLVLNWVPEWVRLLVRPAVPLKPLAWRLVRNRQMLNISSYG